MSTVPKSIGQDCSISSQFNPCFDEGITFVSEYLLLRFAFLDYLTLRKLGCNWDESSVPFSCQQNYSPRGL